MRKVILLSFLFLALGVASTDLLAQCNQCSMSGPSSINQGATSTYSTSGLSGASYFWSTTGGLSIQGGNTGTSVSVRADSGTSGQVCVTRYRAGTAPCCRCRTITIVPPPPPCIEPTSVSIAQTQGSCQGDVFRFTATRFPSNSANGTYSWSAFQGASIISGQNTNSVLVQSPSSGGFSIQVTLTSTCNNKQVTGFTIAEFSNACGGGGGLGGPIIFEPNVYPNPSGNAVTVEVPQAAAGPAPEVTVEVLNESGEVLQTQTLKNARQEVDLSGLPNGPYFIRTRSNGQVLKTTRILKEK